MPDIILKIIALITWPIILPYWLWKEGNKDFVVGVAGFIVLGIVISWIING